MKKDMSVILSYKSKNYKHGNKQLTNHFPLITHLNTYSSFKTTNKNQTQSTNELTYTKNFNANLKNNFSFSNKFKPTKDNNKSQLYYVFKKPKEKIKNKFAWPKLTQPKLPFSKKERIPEEERKRRIREQKPSLIYHDLNMIKWLRNKYSDSLIEKSVFSLLPDNGKPVVPDDETEEDKKHRLLMEYVDSLYKKVPEREKYVNINPKYFFDQKTFQKILKFKEIFLEFDEDQSRKMEIDEMVEMFNQNHIKATLEDLRNLFFKDKKVKKEDIMKLYLDFYQFMNFALTKGQDFRDFMREIKEKNKKKEKISGIGEGPKQEDEEEDEGYLPMNFNLMFDYFLMKGKERASFEEIEKSVEEMDKIINTHKREENDNIDNFNEEKGKLRKNSSIIKYSDISKKNNSSEEIHKIAIDYEEQLKNLNFVHLIENFVTLFHLSDTQTKTMSDSFIELVESHEQNSNIKNLKFKEDNNIKISMFTEKDSNIESVNKKKKNNVSFSRSLNDKTFEKIVKYDINRKILNNLNLKNYKKYHDVNLALTETKKEVNSFITAQKAKYNKTKINNNIFLNNNDNSIIDINSKSKIIQIFNKPKKDKALKLKPLYEFDKTKNYISKNYSNSVKMNLKSNTKDINIINNNENIKSIHKSEISSINSYMSKGENKYKIKTKYDYVPPELLKEKRKKRYFRLFI